MIALLSAAFLLGLFSSLHCAAMCGPLAAGCARATDRAGYVTGRTVAYMSAGAIFGAIGHATALAELEIATVAVLSLALFVHGLSHFRRQRPLVTLPKRRRFHLGRFLPRQGLGLGLATGALPCGALFGAWVLAASSAHPLTGALVMFTFSIASLPGLAIPLFAGRLRLFARLPPAAHGLFWCAVALFVALRPLLVERPGGCH